MTQRAVDAPPEEAAGGFAARVGQSWRITYPLIVAALSPAALAWPTR